LVPALRSIQGGRRTGGDSFEVAYLNVAGEVRRPLTEACEVAFEAVVAVWHFPAYRGQRNYPGLYYAAPMDAHVGVESWLERDEAMALDFDHDVVAFASQPFWLSWPDANGCAHTLQTSSPGPARARAW
jgi:hypothetical protein